MKTTFLSACLSISMIGVISAQTTHFIDWETGVGTDATITIDVGDTIEWEVTDAVPHNVISSDPNAPAGFGSGTLNLGDTYSFTFNAAVVFDYECGFHPAAMNGTITVLAAGSCDGPSNLSIDNVTDATADFSWTASPDVPDGYNWVVMNAGDDPDTGTPVDGGSVSATDTDAMATGLTPGTNYEAYVQTDCGTDGTSAWEGPEAFTTDEAPCEPPTDVMNDSVTETTATFSWMLSASDADADGYVWGVFEAGADPMVDPVVEEDLVFSGENMALIAGLETNTTYDFYMFTLCDGSATPVIMSDIIGPVTFTTETIGIDPNAIPGFSFYPNPAEKILYLEAEEPLESVEMLNLVGQKVRGTLFSENTVDVSGLPSGLYLMRVTSGGQTGVYRVIKK